MTFEEAMKAGHLDKPKEQSTTDKAKSMGESAVRGFANAATFGMAPKISAGANALLGKVAPDTFGTQDYGTRLKEYLDADKAAEAANPVTSTIASLVPNAIQAVATGGGSLARQAAVNTGLGAVNAYGNSEATNPLNADVLAGAGTAGVLSAAPGLIGKGIGKAADAISGKTINSTIADVNKIMTEKVGDWKDAAARRMGTTTAEMKRDGISLKDLKETFKEYLTANRDNPLDLQMDDEVLAPMIKDVLKKTTPSAVDVAKDVGKTVLGGAAGAGAVGAANYGVGGPMDPAMAATAGAILGGHRAAGNLTDHIGKKAAHAISTTNFAPVAEKYASKPVGALTQLGVQAATKDITEAAGASTSPFGSLSDYLKAFNTPDDKRKAAMDLASDAEGRAVGNTDSPLRK